MVVTPVATDLAMRDTDWLWHADQGSRSSMEVLSEGQKHRLGFDLRSRKERMKDKKRRKNNNGKQRKIHEPK